MRWIVVLLLLVLPAEAASQQAPRAVHRTAGCYELILGSWSPAIPAAPDSAAPARVVLDTLPASGPYGEGAFQIRPAPEADSTVYQYLSWAPLPTRGDSLRILWTTTFAGMEARLQLRGDTLHGQALAYTDVGDPGRPTSTAEVTGRRVEPCPIGGTRRARGSPAYPAPAPRPPPGRSEQILGWSIGGIITWILLHFTGIL